MGPLGSGLDDSDSYVRMVAASGDLELYYLSASTHKEAATILTWIPNWCTLFMVAFLQNTQDFGGMDDTLSSQMQL